MVTNLSRTGRGGLLRVLLIFGAVLGAVTLLDAAGVRASGDCVSIRVDAPLRLPDGSVHPSGSLTICHSIRYSPVSSLHATYVNGQPLGLLRSRTRTSEIGDDAPAIVYFNRSNDGTLELFGYVVPERDTSVTYLFRSREARQAAIARNSKGRNKRKFVTSPSTQPGLVAVAVPTP